jgi:hypothetical protein
VAVLELLPCDAQLEDSFGQLRHCRERLLARAVRLRGSGNNYPIVTFEKQRLTTIEILV